ncbi:TonB-dependent receptor plug domain-containing protein [Fulvivirga kasyanovii]|uniref:TonB-dependent receptor plug domain-containing protein n=1 Tax=Fulvivirga kasyanovii TaxID=396812 RepID=UPI0031D609F2
MTRFYKLFILLMLAVCLSSVDLLAQDESAYTEQELYDLSLEELLNVKVTTASKAEETVQDAPGIVSVVTANEIEAYGASNLAEVLDRVTGIYMTGSYTLTNNLPVVRGEATAHWATKVLILIDGRPHRDSYLGGTLMPLLNAYPVNAIERLEVVRGPGSVLYGTNAFTGVINIITKKATASNFTTSTRYGSFDTRQSSIHAGIKHNDLTVDASLNFYNTDGWDFTARGEKAIIRSNTSPVYDSIVNPARTINMARRDIGATLNTSYKGLTFNSFYGFSNWEAMHNAAQWVVPSGAGPNETPIPFEVYSKKMFADLGYKKEVTSFLTSSLNLTWNRTTFDLARADYKNRPIVTLANDLLAEWSNSIKIRSNLDALIGFNINNQQGHGIQETNNADGTPYLENKETHNPNGFYYVPEWNETWYSGYAQLSYQPVRFLKLVGGMQANKVTGIDVHYSPRLAVVVRSKSGFGGKLLYGKAFRSATAGGEKALNIPGLIIGNHDLLPEEIGTAEVQFFIVKKKFEASVNYFTSDQTNQIVRTSATDPANKIPNTVQYVNRGSQTSHGFEAEGKFYLSPQWKGVGSFASQQTKNNLGYKNYGGTPLYMAKFGMQYESERGVEVGVFNTYYSKGGNIQAKFSSDNTPADFVGTATNANPEMKAINYLTANIQLHLPELLRNPSMADVTLFCYMVNILDQQVYYPEFSRRVINTYPGRAGFNIHGGVIVKL